MSRRYAVLAAETLRAIRCFACGIERETRAAVDRLLVSP